MVIFALLISSSIISRKRKDTSKGRDVIILEPDPTKNRIMPTKSQKVSGLKERGRTLRDEREEYLRGVRIERERIAEEKRIEQEKVKKAELEKIRLEVAEKERIEKEKELEIAKQTKVEEGNSGQKKVNRGNSSGRSLGRFQATAYDLSYASCQKNPGDKGYGITRSGVSLAGHSLESARAIAVDPNVIPLGSTVHIEFEQPYGHLTGNYKAVDTGGAIKGRIVDIFMGSGNVSSQVSQFGRRKVSITIVD